LCATRPVFWTKGTPMPERRAEARAKWFAGATPKAAKRRSKRSRKVWMELVPARISSLAATRRLGRGASWQPTARRCVDTLAVRTSRERRGEASRGGNLSGCGTEAGPWQKASRRTSRRRGDRQGVLSWRDVHQAIVDAELPEGATPEEAWLIHWSRDELWQLGVWSVGAVSGML
jgi:hypothetical protein